MFRKILALFMALTILTCSAGLAATLDETQLKSKSCILMDAATGEVTSDPRVVASSPGEQLPTRD